MTEPTARERLAEKLCEAAVHMHLIDENASWQAMWLRVADVALEAREEALAPFVAMSAELQGIADDLGWAVGAHYAEVADRIRRAIAEAGGDE